MKAVTHNKIVEKCLTNKEKLLVYLKLIIIIAQKLLTRVDY